MRKNFLRLHILLFFLAPMPWQYVYSQIATPEGLKKNRSWEELMDDPSVNFYDVKSKFDEYWSGKEIQKGKGYNVFKRWEWYMEQRTYPTGVRPPHDVVIQAMKQKPEMFLAEYSKNKNNLSSWSYIGNNEVPSNRGGAGRINSVRNLPGNHSVWFACAPAGGLWKTEDSGNSWHVLGTDFLPIIGVSDLAINPKNLNVIYIATGDYDGNNSNSIGVWKSTNGGISFEATDLTWEPNQNVTISRLLLNPDFPDIILAATSSGIYRTVNGGSKWDLVVSGNFAEIKYKPGDSQIIHAVGKGSTHYYRSSDGGGTWNPISNGLPVSGALRMAVAVSQSNPNVVYILAADSDTNNKGGLLGVYKSINGGDSFNKVANKKPNLLGWAADGSDDKGQGSYDLQIEVDPLDEKSIYVGGVNIWKSTNSGIDWDIIGHWSGDGVEYIHADIHSFYFIPNTDIMLIGNDGGVWTTDNGGQTFKDKSSNLAISQQYRLGISANDADKLLTGWQDNGTNYKNVDHWEVVAGGDGFECYIDPNNSDLYYFSIYYGYIFRKNISGIKNIACNGLKPDCLEPGSGVHIKGSWLTPYALGTPSSSIYVGKSTIFKSLDEGENWKAMESFGNGLITAMALSPSDNNVIYASKGPSLFKTENGGDSFIDVEEKWSIDSGSQTNGKPNMPFLWITSIAVHPNNPQKLWVAVSGYEDGSKVFYSENGGGKWMNISGNLPNLPVNTIVYQNGTDDGLYIGMDVGVYYRDNSTGDWEPYSMGLPNVPVMELEIHYASGTITAATFGRGTWRAPLKSVPNTDLALISMSLEKHDLECATEITPKLKIQNTGLSEISSFEISFKIDNYPPKVFAWQIKLNRGQSINISIPSYNYGGGKFSITSKITKVDSQNYDNNSNNDILSLDYTLRSDINIFINGEVENDVICSSNSCITLNATATCGYQPLTFNWNGGSLDDGGSLDVCSTGLYTINVMDKHGNKASKTTFVLFIPVLCSRDPNDIIGPTGYGDPKWVSINDKLPYKIRFENDPDFATAPAQRVAIEHHPDEDLNLFSVRLGDFGFANQFFTVPDNSTFYNKRLDLRDSLGIFVDVTAGIDVTDNKVFWIFQSIDPATGLPPSDPTVGLLPVNDTLLQNGEGFVDFTVRPKSTAVTGDSILAKASIVFDDNETIFTPEIFNIIDALPPASAIIPNLPATIATPAFQICWNGHDDPGGCGIRDYTLYYSTNGGPFLAYQSGIADTCVSFTGLPGNTYSFYTLAADNVGNTEPDKTAGDISVSISDENKLVLFALSDDALCAGDSLTLQWEASGVGRVKVLLSSGGSNTLLQDNLPAAPGLFTWHIPAGFAGCNDCRLIVADTAAGSPLSDTSFVIQIHPAITADAGPDISLCAGKSISLLATGGDQYAWSPDTGLDDPLAANPTLTATQTLTYIVQVRNAAGCSDTDSINIQILPADIISLVSMTCDASEAGVHYDTLTNRFGCDSVVITGVILDTIPPQAACKALTLALDETGQAPLSPESADNGSTDNCGIATLSLSRTGFTCADLGQNPVLLTLTDVNGNSATCVSTVTVADNNLPPACGGGGPAFLFHYPGPDTLGVGAGCTGILDWGADGPVVQSTTGNTITYFALDPALTGYDSGDPVPVNTIVLVAFIAEDDVLHRDTFFFAVVFADLNAPAITCPAPLSVSCDVNLIPQQNPVLGAAAALDACDPAPDVSYSDQQAPGHCPAVTVVSRTWTAMDQAGNSAQCVQTITLEDPAPPAINCPAPVTVQPNNPACSYLTAGTAFDPVPVFDPCNVSTFAYTLTGATAGAGGASLHGVAFKAGNTLITWTAADSCGRTGSCSFNLKVMDCSDISGRLIWPGDDSTGVDSAFIQVGGDFTAVVPTASGGFFSWQPVTGDSFTLTPVKPSPPARWDNGVNAADALAILRHVAGIAPITDPYLLIAADVDLDNAVTGADAVVIRRALLKSASAIAVMQDSTWRFVPTPPVYVPGANPFAAPIPERRSVMLAGSGQDFYGIKKGDVNGTAKPGLLHPVKAPPLVLLVPDHVLQAGEELDAVFRVSHFDHIGAYQVAFQFDPSQIQFITVEPTQTALHLQADDHFGLDNTNYGEIRSVWEAPEGVSLPEGTAIFSLRFKVLRSGALLSEVFGLKPKALKPEATTTDQVPAPVQLIFIEAQSTGTLHPAAAAGVQLLQNRPNPFTGQTIIGFILPAACDAQLQVIDVSGRELLRLDKTYAAGYHEAAVRLGEVANPGMLYYELTTPFGTLVRKMVLGGR